MKGLPNQLYAITLLQLSAALLCSSYRILGIFPVFSKSHISLSRVILKEMASRGHEITAVSYFNGTGSDLGYTEFGLTYLGSMRTYVDNVSPSDAKNFTGFGFYFDIFFSGFFEKDMCSAILSSDYVKKVLSGQVPAPELLFVEMFANPCVLSIAAKFDIPTVVLMAATDTVGPLYVVGNPTQPAYIPWNTNGFTQNMNFWQRLINWLQYIALYTVYRLISRSNAYILRDNQIVQNENVINYNLSQRTDMVFYNSHFSFINRPTVPNAIEIGGAHIQQAKPLQSDVYDFIEQSESGVIFVSFGSSLNVSSFDERKLQIFKKVFSKIPQRVLWRSSVNASDFPPNVMVKQWFSQRDVLEHKKVKAFISHGGIFGTYEAIHTGTPVVGIPFMFDQYTNINILQEKGAAIYLDFDTLTYDALFDALHNIIYDNRYYTNMQTLSKIFKDRPMSPLDTAVYWMEYLVRHKRAEHLKVKSADMPFYEFLLLDVIGFVLLVFSILIFIVYYIVKKFLLDLSE